MHQRWKKNTNLQLSSGVISNPKAIVYVPPKFHYFASISHPASLRFPVSKTEPAPFSRVLGLKKLQLSTRATIPCPVVGACGAILPLCFIKAKARTL
jgi:hypothetical protein